MDGHNNMKKIKYICIFIFIVLFVVGCGKNENIKERIINAIDKGCKNQNECIVSISNLTSFTWDKLLMFNEGASSKEINRVLGFKYKGTSDLTIISVFLYKGKIVHQESESYNPEKPSKLFIKYPNPLEHHLIFTPQNANFKAKILNIDGKNYYEITPIIE